MEKKCVLGACNPRPANGATGVPLDTDLCWPKSEEADSYDVYFGTDFNDVIYGRRGTFKGNQIARWYDPGTLKPCTTYYWKVEPVIEEEGKPKPSPPWPPPPVPTWPPYILDSSIDIGGVRIYADIYIGDVWSFKTVSYLVVDDMESYTDDLGNRIFETWIDGLGYTYPPPGHPGNGTGSKVGYREPPYAEQTIVYQGKRSMPFSYDNSTANYSQAERRFDTPQNWSRCGIKALSLRFYGDLNNEPEPMYLAVQDTAGISAVVVHEDADVTLMETWQGWTICLEEFTNQGVNLTGISSIAIGFGNRDNPQPGGRGTVYFDDIQLSTYPCPIAEEPNECKVYIRRMTRRRGYPEDLGFICVPSPWTYEEKVWKPVESIEIESYFDESGRFEIEWFTIFFKDGDYYEVYCCVGDYVDNEWCKMDYNKITSEEGMIIVTVKCINR